MGCGFESRSTLKLNIYVRHVVLFWNFQDNLRNLGIKKSSIRSDRKGTNALLTESLIEVRNKYLYLHFFSICEVVSEIQSNNGKSKHEVNDLQVIISPVSISTTAKLNSRMLWGFFNMEGFLRSTIQNNKLNVKEATAITQNDT